jgi:hypothetical protein
LRDHTTANHCKYDIGDAWPDPYADILLNCAATPGVAEGGESRFTDTVQVRSFSSQRMAQLRSALLVALTRGTDCIQQLLPRCRREIQDAAEVDSMWSKDREHFEN